MNFNRLIVVAAMFASVTALKAAESEKIVIPKIGMPSVARVGDTLYEESDYAQIDEIVPESWQLNGSIDDHAGISGFEFGVGTPLKKISDTKFCVQSEPHKCFYDDDGDGNFDRLTARPGLIKYKQTLAVPISYTHVESKIVTRLAGGSFKRELVYLGVSGQTLRVLYREFSDNLARPAFTQELTYPVTPEKSAIAFRSLQIEVTKIQPTEVHYSVKKGSF